MMTNEYEDKRRKRNLFLHSIYNYAMGALWLSLGIVSLFSKKLGIDLKIDNQALLTIFGVACIMYGLFRIWRGFKKHY
jgi:hypothetical protein